MTVTADQSPVRFGLAVDSDNGHHVHFRVFAATGGQHLGGCGSLVMTSDEYAAFKELLEPQLTDRSDPASQFKPGWLQEQVARSVESLGRLPEGLRRTIRGEKP